MLVALPATTGHDFARETTIHCDRVLQMVAVWAAGENCAEPPE